MAYEILKAEQPRCYGCGRFMDPNCGEQWEEYGHFFLECCVCSKRVSDYCHTHGTRGEAEADFYGEVREALHVP